MLCPRSQATSTAVDHDPEPVLLLCEVAQAVQEPKSFRGPAVVSGRPLLDAWVCGPAPLPR